MTASGKVMETDADLMRKTLERKRHETKAASSDEEREHGNRESGRSLAESRQTVLQPQPFHRIHCQEDRRQREDRNRLKSRSLRKSPMFSRRWIS